VITKLDGHLLLHPELATELLDLLDLLDEVLRYGSDDLRHDIADRFHPRMHAHLIEALDTHAGQLRRATNRPSQGLTPR
jgi:hypothetical protein